MEEIVDIDGKQYRLSYDQPLTLEQRTQAITNIRNTAPQLPTSISITDMKVGDIDCPSGTCPDMTCTSIGCTIDTRDVVVRYSNSGNSSVNIIPYITVAKLVVDVNDAIKNGADRLLQTQKNDGTWQWSNPDTDPGATSYPAINNILGVTARGLVRAYLVTENTIYLNAAKRTADLLVSKTPDGFGPDDAGIIGKHKVYGQDITFLVEFARAWESAGNDASAYSTKANDYMNVILTGSNRFCAEGCLGNESALVENNFSERQPNLYGWDIRGWVEAAVKTGNMAFAQAIVSNMVPHESSLSSTATGTYSTGYSYVLGLSGYLDSYIMTGKTPEEYSAIKDKLLSELDTNGSFKIYAGTDDGIDQTAAYALMALSLTNTDMTNTINYLISAQSQGGMWIENDGSEYTEVDSEIIVALSSYVTPYFGTQIIPVPAGTYIDVTFSNIVLTRGINNVCGNWSEIYT